MKSLEILRFEVGYQSRGWWTWLYVAAMLVISFEIGVKGYLESAQEGGYWFNSPFGIASMTLIGSIMGLLVAAAFTVESLLMLWWSWLFFTGHWAS